MSKTNYVEEAKYLRDIGISVIPAQHETKAPAIKWKEYQERYMTNVELQLSFQDCGGIIAICGPISRLFLLDFDLKNELEHHDYWSRFMEMAPKSIIDKCLINKTRNNGYHIWFRTDYTDKSRKLTRRFLTPSEIQHRYDNMLEAGSNHDTAMRLILNNPTECVIETRGDRSYGVFLHPSYTRHQGKGIGNLSVEEVNTLINICYSLDCMFKQKKTYTGQADAHRIIEEFKSDCGAEGMVRLLERSGMYELQELDTNGNYRMKRVGSDSKFSGYVYGDSGLFKSFGQSALDPDRDVLDPFDIYCLINEYSIADAIEAIRTKKSS